MVTTQVQSSRVHGSRLMSDEDELFFTLEGKLIIDIEDGESVELSQQQGYVVPKGVVHRTRAPEKTIILMVERAGIIPTGDA